MNTNLQDLLRKRIIEKAGQDKGLAAQLLSAADNDLIAAEDIAARKHFGWALAIAYNAMLSAGKALMAKMGYRAASEGHHIAVVQFCATVMPAESEALVSAFNRYRIRRHDVVYGRIVQIPEGEAKNAVAKAKEFVARIRSMCKV